MGLIELGGIKVYAFHGFYEEERKAGNYYIISIAIQTDFSLASASDLLENTVDYEEVYAIIKEEMSISSKLLEHVGGRIVNSIKSRYPKIEKITLEVAKLNPPVGGLCRQSKITINS